jgi:hypothetical protein
MNIHQPRPTEYKGVVFRSKTKAIYACAFASIGFLWQYEPFRYNDLPGPDFLLAWQSEQQTIVMAVAEVKPRRPNDTYIESLKKSIRDYGGSCKNRLLIFGSPFDDSIPRGILDLEDDICNRAGTWQWLAIALAEGFIRARSYRFDL